MKIQKEVKWKIIAGIDKNELVLLKFTKEETETKLNWKHSKEFEYNKEMYDIVETEVNGDTISYWCWHDHEETALNRKLADVVAKTFGSNPKSKEKQKQLLDFFKSLYCTSATTYMTPPEVLNSEGFNYSGNFTSLYSSPPVPPPELINMHL
ncbi:MAG TPA: hypothetical protein VIK89_11025 [Cytophagaceae bacterium]